MQGFSLDYDRCVRCGRCMAVCNRNALQDNGEGAPMLTEEQLAQCNACGHCSAVCHANAIISPKCNGEAALPLDSTLAVSYQQASQFLLSCRSVRLFKQQEVARDEILDLLDLVRKAPSASNAQPVSWLLIGGQEKTRRITELTVDWFDTVVRNDPTILGGYNVDYIVDRFRGGYDIILRGAPNVVCAITDKAHGRSYIDACISMTYFCLAAHGKNIGSCWAGFVMRAALTHAPLREYLKLGDNLDAHAIAFFGYPDVQYAAIPPRNALKAEWL